MDLIKSIRKLRILALLLFIIPVIGLLGSLFLHNYLIKFKFDTPMNFGALSIIDEPGSIVKFKCDASNGYCGSKEFLKEGNSIIPPKSAKLSNCFLYKTSANWVIDGKIYNSTYSGRKELYIDYDESQHLSGKLKVKEKYKNSDIVLELFVIDEKNPVCIRNSNSFYLYKLIPFWFEGIVELKQGLKLGTNETINPFFYGESSISNIVKRYPINYFFKPSIYLTIIFMLFYWIYYNNIIKKLTGYSKNYYFFIFGILSASFLFLHIFFLGWTFESEFLTKLRRTFIVFFILFEILSQAFLIKKILSIKDEFSKFFHSLIITLKLIFVIFICASSILILSILVFYDFSSKFDYILEWNYFLILLFFYFLSFLMWKKLINNPSST